MTPNQTTNGTAPTLAAHTPGPWRAAPSTAGGGVARMDIVSDGAEFSPSFVAGDVLPDDARLIAAAPALLAALETLCADTYLSDPINADRMREARAAIALARA